jgi:hypothetical protein
MKTKGKVTKDGCLNYTFICFNAFLNSKWWTDRQLFRERDKIDTFSSGRERERERERERDKNYRPGFEIEIF